MTAVRRQRTETTAEASAKGSLGAPAILDTIERVGNKVPHPAIIFVGLSVVVIVLSAILAAST